MKIDKAKLEKLQGLCPCTSSVTFVPSVYDEFKKDDDMSDYIPSFTCDALTVGQVEAIKGHGVDRIKCAKDEKAFTDKKDKMVSIIGESITGWSNLYDISTGEKLEYSSELVKDLPENVVESIMMELSRYAGIVPRGI